MCTFQNAEPRHELCACSTTIPDSSRNVHISYLKFLLHCLRISSYKTQKGIVTGRRWMMKFNFYLIIKQVWKIYPFMENLFNSVMKLLSFKDHISFERCNTDYILGWFFNRTVGSRVLELCMPINKYTRAYYKTYSFLNCNITTQWINAFLMKYQYWHDVIKKNYLCKICLYLST